MKKPVVTFITLLLTTVVLFTSATTSTLYCPLTVYAKDTCFEDVSIQNAADAFTNLNKVKDCSEAFIANVITYKNMEVIEQEPVHTTLALMNAKSPIKDNATKWFRQLQRGAAVGYMKEMATVKWTPSKTFRHWSSDRKWKKGTTYYGIPYTQNNRNNGLKEFEKHLEKGKYTGRTDSQYIGNDCSSAVAQAYNFVSDGAFDTKNRYTGTLTPGSKNIKKVGDYSFSGSTYNSTRKNGKAKMLKAYNNLQAGDLVVVTGVKNPHVMLVSGTTSNGITVVHQTTYDENLKSTWRVDEYCSFNSLYNAGYIPVTMYIS